MTGSEVDYTGHLLLAACYGIYLAGVQPWTLPGEIQGHIILAGGIGIGVGAQVMRLGQEVDQ